MDKWKEEFYEKYSTIFGKTISADTYNQFFPYGMHIVKKCFPMDKSIRVLDVGCGIGGFIHVFNKAGYTNVEGIDISDEEVRHAHAFGITQVRQSELFNTLRAGESQGYDVILFIDVLEHFKHDEVLEILREVNRNLKPGGWVIIHVPNAEGIFGSKVRYADFTHDQAFTEKSLSQILKYAGFNSFKCYEDKPVIHGPISLIRRIIWDLGTIPFRIMHAAETGSFSIRLSQNILFKAVKPGD